MVALGAAAVALLVSLGACSAPPGASRAAIASDPGWRASPLVADDELVRRARVEYRGWLEEERRRDAAAASPATVARVRAIVDRLGAAAGAIRPATRDWRWELAVAAGGGDAWCLPGGELAVGALLADRFAGDDDALAALVAHGIGHALIGHPRERTPMIADEAHPFRATHESEADRIGVELAARAGFDPRAAARAIRSLAERPAAAPGAAGRAEPAWPRIHPMYEGRFVDLETYSARVEPFYRQALR